MDFEKALHIATTYMNLPHDERLRLRADAATALDTLALTDKLAFGHGYFENVLRHVRPSIHTLRQWEINVGSQWKEQGRWVATNPSLLAFKHGYMINYRLVNYRNSRASYYVLEEDSIIRSRNILQHLGVSGEVLGEYPLELGSYTSDKGPFQGLEDIRLIDVQGTVCFSASYAQMYPLGVPRMVFGRTDLSLNDLPLTGTPVHVKELVPLTASPVHVTEKNWMPVNNKGSLYWIYGIHPFRLLRYTGSKGNGVEDTPILSSPLPLNLSSLRGSAGPVHVQGRCFSLVHFYSSGDGRWYHHRWVEHNPDTLVPVGVSASFCFHPRPDDVAVEFAAGLCVGHDGHLWVSFGREDRESHLAVVDLCDVLALQWYPSMVTTGQ